MNAWKSSGSVIFLLLSGDDDGIIQTWKKRRFYLTGWINNMLKLLIIWSMDIINE